MHISRRVRRGIAVATAALLMLGGCGGGSDDAAVIAPPPVGGPSPPPPSDTGVEHHVSGSVGDGPIVGARIRVYANSGLLMQETESSITADYELTVNTRGGRLYPLTIVADQGTDLVTGRPPDFKLSYALYRLAEQTTINLNPFSTLVFQVARTNGGINDSTVIAARHAVVSRYGFGLDSAVLPDPVETFIDDGNIHYIVKASEALGEMIRRTRDAVAATGWDVDGDFIVAALATDLADGWIDGKSTHQSSSRLAAVANVASAAVLVEALSNQLRVYGVNATAAMDQSIRQVRPDAPQSATTANVPIAAETFQQAIRALRAAQLVNPDPRIATTIRVLENATPGTLPKAIALQLPAGIHGVLRQATTDTAYVSEAVLDAINIQARSSSAITPPPGTDPEPPPPPPPPAPEPTPPPPPPPANNPPVISGSPNTSLVVGTAWSFTPTASDPDGDALTFSITGRPSWLSFNSSTGRLSGTPGSSRVGTNSNIRISVTDGIATTQLPAFSITVTAPELSTRSATLSWTPPTERTDGSPLGSLSGFKIYYGRNRSNLNQVVNIGSGITTYILEGLEPGAWHFGVTAVDTNGIESALSTVVSKTIP